MFLVLGLFPEIQWFFVKADAVLNFIQKIWILLGQLCDTFVTEKVMH